MKKILLTLLLVLFTTCCNTGFTNKNLTEYKIEQCSFDFGFVYYCDERHKKTYQNITKHTDKNNIYNTHYSLYLIPEDDDDLSLIAYNLKTNLITPLPHTLRLNDSSKVLVNTKSNLLCFQDSELQAYKDNIFGEVACFTMENNHFERQFYESNEVDRMVLHNQLLGYVLPLLKNTSYSQITQVY